MFEAASMLFIYVETPLHAGTGRGLGGIDLPIQRERTTKYPFVQASGLKGRLRAEARRMVQDGQISLERFHAIFGPEPGSEEVSEYAGALAVGDARLLLFPVRSLAGVFAWTTSSDVLARFLRDAQLVGLQPGWDVPPEPAPGEALVGGDAVLAGGKVVLEEFTFSSREEEGVRDIGQWLADNALPQEETYRYWRETLSSRLVILPRDAFRDFTTFATEVVTRVRLETETKTVEEGALWTEECLPADTLLYAPLMASSSRNAVPLDGSEVLWEVQQLGLTRVVLGGDETIGRGVVALRFVNGGGTV